MTSATALSLAPRNHVRLAVDCMGGDVGPAVTLPACEAFLKQHADAELLLVGEPTALASAAQWKRCTILPASQVVTMHDSVKVALSRKRDSSMRIAVDQLKADANGQVAADAVVSAGNTGALMAVSRFVLRTLEGIDRPAIAAFLPHAGAGYTCVLDLGANVDCSAEHLLQFAVMGSALVTAIEGTPDPRVGLLNVGEEAIKGSDMIKRAGELLRTVAAASHLNYHGNVEGNDIFKGTTDVVVCDGFVGNVALKSNEGVAKMMKAMLREEFERSWGTRVAYLFARPVLKRFGARLDPRRYNGAALLGLKGLVFKSHGGADAFAFGQALARAHEAARN
ncbi:MAG TPA: phosphate acyltransferase PlsX, partial [Burkholderiaceae bacterium]|nr:phosphate acyltransferase PlsX [Burkholderiaceae bacterium]